MYALKKGDVKVLFMPGCGSPQEEVNKFGKILADGLSSDEQTKEGHQEDQLILEHVVVLDGDVYDNLPKSHQSSLKIHHLQKLKETQSTANLDTRITDLVSPDDPAIIMFTSKKYLKN